MKEKVLIPECTQVILDDVGWLWGYDDRKNGGPSRTAMPRRHCAEDYKAIEMLGELLDMKVNCGFVIGEWDPDNRLRQIPHLSKYGEEWNNAAYLKDGEVESCVAVINESDYIDPALHGLMHGYYISEIDNCDCSDFYYCKEGKLYMIPEEEVRLRLDAFFSLWEYYGVKKKINSFIPPSFAYRFEELSGILQDYGIEYISTKFKTMKYEGDKMLAAVENGIITVDRKNNPIPFDQFDCKYDELDPVCGVFGAHWPNILQLDPGKNPEAVRSAASYLKKCASRFGALLSKDMGFCASQSLYRRYIKMESHKDAVLFDLSEVPKAKCHADSFYVSTKTAPVRIEGGSLEMYERQGDYATYKVTPAGAQVCMIF